MLYKFIHICYKTFLTYHINEASSGGNTTILRFYLNERESSSTIAFFVFCRLRLQRDGRTVLSSDPLSFRSRDSRIIYHAETSYGYRIAAVRNPHRDQIYLLHSIVVLDSRNYRNCSVFDCRGSAFASSQRYSITGGLIGQNYFRPDRDYGRIVRKLRGGFCSEERGSATVFWLNREQIAELLKPASNCYSPLRAPLSRRFLRTIIPPTTGGSQLSIACRNYSDEIDDPVPTVMLRNIFLCRPKAITLYSVDGPTKLHVAKK